MQLLQTDASAKWVDIEPVSYTLSDDEAAAAVKAQAVPRVGCWVPIRWMVLGVGNIILGLLRSHFEPNRGQGWPIFYVTTGVAYIALGVWQWRSSGLQVDRQRDFVLQFTDYGIELGPPPSKLLPWRSVDSVTDTSESFAFQCAQRAPLILPKRAFPDRGAALWLALEAQLIAPYNLHRRPDSHLIFNTKSRQATSYVDKAL